MGDYPEIRSLEAVVPDAAESRTATRAVLWRVDAGTLTRHDARLALEALGLTQAPEVALSPVSPLLRHRRGGEDG